MASDPVEIVAEELRVQRETGAPKMSARTHGAGAWLVLNTLYEAGWRIVLPQDGVELDTLAIADEWTPTGDRAVSTGEDPTDVHHAASKEPARPTAEDSGPDPVSPG